MTTEYGQRLLIDCDSSSHESTRTILSDDDDDEDALMANIERNFGSAVSTSTSSYGSNLFRTSHHIHTIRFQVVVWNIGKLDVATGSVPMLFRVSLFWNDLPTHQDQNAMIQNNGHNNNHPNNKQPSEQRKRTVNYTMQGRTKAMPNRSNSTTQEEEEEGEAQAVDVPPLSILNVSTFTIIGSPEVDLFDPAPLTRLFRWTCMYRATVMQEQLTVQEFPHDCHAIALELAILTHRRAGQRWDRRFWKLGLATEEDVRDSRKALRVPHGLVVDHVRIPEFHRRSLQFQFCSQQNGSFDRRSSFCAIPDVTLKVQLLVLRESGYYDRNIVPLLAFLNVIAATLTLVLDAEKFFYRGLLILNIAFNQMGVRLAVDKHLPSVGYEIRLQKILNEFFFVLLALILEAALVYGLATEGVFDIPALEWIDGIAALGALGHNGYTIASYYEARTQARQKYNSGVWDQQDTLTCRDPLIV